MTRNENSTRLLSFLRIEQHAFVVNFVAPLLIALAVIITYSNAFTGAFLFDDFPAIVDNMTIRSLAPLYEALWAPQEAPTAGRPVVNLSFAGNYAAGQFNVVGFHLTNVLLHVVNAILLFGLIRRTLARSHWGDPWRKSATSVAFVAALLWSLHPLQTEAVTYITQRTELLMAFFFLLTMYAARLAWDSGSIRTRRGWQLISILSCVLGMASKEVMVAAPVIVVLYDLAMLGQPFSILLKRRRMLYLGLIASWCVLASLLATNPRGQSVGFGLSINSWEYLLVQFWAITHYLKLAIWPAELCSDYGIFRITEPSLWLSGFAVLLFLAGLAVLAWFRWRPLSFLGLSLFIILAPTSSFVPIVTEPVAERRMYLPLASFIVLLVSGAFECLRRLVERVPKQASSLEQRLRVSVFLAVASIVVAYAWATHARNDVYQSELTFWTDVTQKRPWNSRAFSNLGFVYLQDNQFELSMSNFKRAIEIEPSNADAQMNLGLLFLRLGSFDESRRHLELALAASPDYSKAIAILGKWYAKQGNHAEAVKHYERALALNPNSAEIHFSRGLSLFHLGQPAESINAYREAIRIDPRMLTAYNNLGNVYSMQQRLAEAAENYREALRIDPTSSVTCTNLGNVLVRSGKHQEAVDWFERAIKLDPGLVNAYFHLGKCCSVLGRDEDAIAAFRQCVSLQSNNVSFWFMLGKAYSKNRRLNDARKCFEKALQLEPGSEDIQRELLQLGQDN